MDGNDKTRINIIKNILKIILKIFYNILIIWCVLLVIVIIMQKVSDSNKSIAGYRLFRVVTGSMLPQYDIGEVVLCKETPAENIEIGDDIVYRGRIGELNGKIIMHEVVNINYDENNKILFHAKGTNNLEEDPEVREEQVFGVVIFKSKILTALYKMATNMYSSFFIILVLVINVFLAFRKDPREQIVQLNSGEEETEEEEIIDDDEEYEEEEIEEDDDNTDDEENE